MRLVFAGTPEFAERALSALVSAGHQIALVLTQPDRPSGRGMRIAESAVKQRARAAGIEVFQPESLRDEEAQARVKDAGADAMVVVAYGLILPRPILEATRLGAINIHASLLPRWRGAAPIQRALLAGDTRTGVTIMQMDEGLDTGPMLMQREIPILPGDDAGSLHERLAALGADLIVEALSGQIPPATTQPAEGATYAAKITQVDAVLDWSRDADHLERVVRAMRPAPGARTLIGGESLKVWRARRMSAAGSAGTILRADHEGIVVACGDGALSLLEVQRAGGKRLSAEQFLRGAKLAAGERIGG
ncbi:MAG: methionyl-tRNA formyltransferase [Burkholderiales bacterium]